MNSASASDFDLDWIAKQSGVDRIHYFHEVDSTNNAALAVARSTASDAMELFLAEAQTAGRGRGANRWFASSGSLTFSLLTRSLALTGEQVPQVSLAVGVAICQAVEKWLPQADVGLKWPNDVFLGDRKLSGILIELPATADRRLVIGVGVNVNNSFQSASTELRFNATSMIEFAESEQVFDRSAVLIECLLQMDHMLNKLSRGDASLPELWRSYSYLSGKWVRLETAQSEIAGQCRGIDDDGALLVEASSGLQRCYGGVVAEYR